MILIFVTLFSLLSSFSHAEDGSKSAHCSPLFSTTPTPETPNKSRVGPLFHIFPKLTYSGLSGVRQALREIRFASDGLLLGPVNEQTLHHMPNGLGGITDNLMGYWPKNHKDVDPQLGGEDGFIQTVQTAQSLGFQEIWVDMVYGHFGYSWKDILRYSESTHASYIHFNPEQKLIRLHHLDIPALNPLDVTFDGVANNLDNLILAGLVRPLNTPDVQNHHWDELSNIRDPNSHRILELWTELSQLSLFGLHGLNHNHPAVIDYLTKSFLKFADAGITGFRLDAALYVSPKATAEIINRVHLKYPKTKFLLELLVEREAVLHRMMTELEHRVQHPENIYYFDFPQSSEIRRIQYQTSFQLGWYMGFLQHQNRLNMNREKLIPTIINHDFGKVLPNETLSEVIHALTEFTHFNSTLNYPHTDIANENSRHLIKDYLFKKDPIANLIQRFHSALVPYRNQTQSFLNPLIWTGSKWEHLNSLSKELIETHLSQEGAYFRDSLIMKLELPNREIILFVKKDSTQSQLSIPVTNKHWTHYTQHYTSNNPQIKKKIIETHGGQSVVVLEIQTLGPSVALIEFNN